MCPPDDQFTRQLIHIPRPRHLRAWTLQEIQKLRELATRGLDPQAIARHLRRSINAVRIKANHHGISLRQLQLAKRD
jgi:hypothetical protein